MWNTAAPETFDAFGSKSKERFGRIDAELGKRSGRSVYTSQKPCKKGRGRSWNKDIDPDADYALYCYGYYIGSCVFNVSALIVCYIIFLLKIINYKFEKKERIFMNQIKNFLTEEDGIGVVELILILVVLIGLVLIFKDSLRSLVETIFETITQGAADVSAD